jgi:hypothetical protein
MPLPPLRRHILFYVPIWPEIEVMCSVFYPYLTLGGVATGSVFSGAYGLRNTAEDTTGVPEVGRVDLEMSRE